MEFNFTEILIDEDKKKISNAITQKLLDEISKCDFIVGKIDIADMISEDFSQTLDGGALSENINFEAIGKELTNAILKKIKS